MEFHRLQIGFNVRRKSIVFGGERSQKERLRPSLQTGTEIITQKNIDGNLSLTLALSERPNMRSVSDLGRRVG